MADFDRKIFDDERFLGETPERQREIITHFEPGFGELDAREQDQLIKRATSVFPSRDQDPRPEPRPPIGRYPKWWPNANPVTGPGGPGEPIDDPRNAVADLAWQARDKWRGFGDYLSEIGTQAGTRREQIEAIGQGSAASVGASGAEAVSGAIDFLTDTEWDPVSGYTPEIDAAKAEEILAEGKGPRRPLREDVVPWYLMAPHVAKQAYDVTVPGGVKAVRQILSMPYGSKGKLSDVPLEPTFVGRTQERVENLAKRLRKVESKYSQREHPELDIPGPLDELYRAAISAGGTIGILAAGGWGLGVIGALTKVRGLHYGVLPAYEAMIARAQGGGTNEQAAGALHGAGIVLGLRGIGKLDSAMLRTPLGAMLFGGQPAYESAKGNLFWEDALAELIVGGYFGWKGGINPNRDKLDALAKKQEYELMALRPEKPVDVTDAPKGEEPAPKAKPAAPKPPPTQGEVDAKQGELDTFLGELGKTNPDLAKAMRDADVTASRIRKFLAASKNLPANEVGMLERYATILEGREATPEPPPPPKTLSGDTPLNMSRESWIEASRLMLLKFSQENGRKPTRAEVDSQMARAGKQWDEAQQVAAPEPPPAPAETPARPEPPPEPKPPAPEETYGKPDKPDEGYKTMGPAAQRGMKLAEERGKGWTWKKAPDQEDGLIRVQLVPPKGLEPPGEKPARTDPGFENRGPREYPAGEAPQLAPRASGEDAPVVWGAEHTMRLATQETVRARYGVMERADMIASHDPTKGFQPTPGYNQAYQGKDYADKSKGYANEVVTHAGKEWDAPLILNADPTPIGGPPIFIPAREVVGGGGRKQTIDLRYKKDPQRTKAEMVEAGPMFGIPSEAVAGFKEPVIGRVLLERIPQNAEEARALSSVLNEGLTAVPTGEAEGAGLAARMGEKSFGAMDAALDRADPTATLNDTLLKDRGLPAALVADKVIPENAKAKYVDEDGYFTKEGRALVETMTFAGVVPNDKIRAKVSDSLRNKLVRLAPSMMRAKRFDRERVQQLIDDVVESEVGRSAAGSHLVDFNAPGLEGVGGYPSQRNPLVALVHPTLAPGGTTTETRPGGQVVRVPAKSNRGGMTELEAREPWVRFADRLSERRSGQGRMFESDDTGGVVDFDTAIRESFGPNAVPGKPKDGPTERPAPDPPKPDQPTDYAIYDPKPGFDSPVAYPDGEVPRWSSGAMWAPKEQAPRELVDGSRRRSRTAIVERSELSDEFGPAGEVSHAVTGGDGDVVVLPGGQVVSGLATLGRLDAMGSSRERIDLLALAANAKGFDPVEMFGRFRDPVMVEVLLDSLPQNTGEVRALMETLVGQRTPSSAIDGDTPQPVEGPEFALEKSTTGPGYKGFPDFALETPWALIPRGVRKQGDIMYRLAKAFVGVAPKQGPLPEKGLPPGVMGLREQITGKMRIKKWGDIATFAHEISHHIQEKYPAFRALYEVRENPDGTIERSEVARQMERQTYDVEKDRAEGAAEFLRHWLTNKPHVLKEAPDAVEAFENFIRTELPKKEARALWRAQRDMHRHFGQGIERGLQTMYGDPGRDPSDAHNGFGAKFRETVADAIQGFLQFERRIHGGPLPDGLYEAGRLLRGLGDLVEGMFNYGALKWRLNEKGERTGESDFVGESVKEILEPVSPDWKTARKFAHFVDSGRAEMLMREGRESLWTPERIRKGRSYGEGRPEFYEAEKKLDDFRKLGLDYVHAEGFLSDPVYKMLREQWNPVAFFREMAQAGKFSDDSNDLAGYSGMNTLKGSSRNLRPFIERILEGNARLIQAAWENRVKGKAVDLINGPGGGAFAARVSPRNELIRASADKAIQEIAKGLKEAGIEVPKGFLEAEGMLDFINLYMGGKKPYGADIMVYFRPGGNGKPEYYQIFDPMLMRAMLSMRRRQLSPLVNGLNEFRKFRQEAVTGAPPFWAANAIRDVVLSSITTKTGHQLFTALPRGLASAIVHDAHMRDAIANGGSGDMLRNKGHQAWQSAVVRQAQRHNLDPRGFLMSGRFPIFADPKLLWRLFSSPGRVIENTPRMAEFIRAKKQGETSTHAAYLKSEISTDFRMQGTYETTAGRALRNTFATFMFMNSMTVGGDKIYRNLARDPNYRFETAMRFGAFASLVLANHMSNKDHPDIKNMETWDKFANLHFLIPVSDENLEWVTEAFGETTLTDDQQLHIRMPTIWEMGMGANVVKLIYDYLDESADPEERDIARLMGILLKQNMAIGLPVGLDIFYEQTTGEKYFTGAPTEPRFAREEKWMRARGNQGAAARAFGETVLRPGNEFLKEYVNPKWQQSPGTAQALTELIFSSFATYGWALADKYVDPNGPALLFDELPVISRLLERPEKYPKTPRQYHALVNSIGEIYATGKRLEAEENYVLADEYQDRPEMDLVEDARAYQADLREIDHEIEELYRLRDKNMTPQQKAYRKEELRREKLAIQREFIDDAREMGVSIPP